MRPHPSQVPAASLYFSSGTSFEPVTTSKPSPQETGGCGGGGCGGGGGGGNNGEMPYRMVHNDRRDEVVIITSEPLTDVRSDWVQVPNNHLVLVTPQKQVLMAPVYAKFQPCAGAAEAKQVGRTCASIYSRKRLFMGHFLN
jgi:hypothetical protein